MATHQLTNSLGAEIYNAFVYNQIRYQSHYHKGLEFTLVLNGELLAEVNGKNYLLTSGEGLLILPYSAHSYEAKENTETLIIVFSENYVKRFIDYLKGVPTSNKFTLTKETLSLTLSKTNYYNFNGEEKFDDIHAKSVRELITPNELTIKAILYAICAEFFSSVTYEKKKFDGKTELIEKCINYVENNYQNNITGLTMAKALGYDYSYLSREFNSVMKLSVTSLINVHRVEKAISLLKNSNKPLSIIAEESGFQSVRTFNRVFKKITGKSPLKYKK